MYTFTDTDTQSSLQRPAEAVCINGKWLDDEIPAFSTLAVYGREIMGKEIDATEGALDGALFVSHRYPARTLTVRGQIIAADAQEYRAAFNKLNALLTADSLQIVCADEPDKYYTGVLSAAAQPEPGQLSSLVEFEIYCADPFKYSLQRKRFEARFSSEDLYAFLIDVENTGAFPAPVNLTIKHKKRNAFASIKCADRYLGIGDFDEPYTSTSEGPQELLTLQDFINAPAYSVDLLHPGHSTSGRLGTVQIIPDGSTEPKTWLALTTKGTATTDGAGCGGVRQVSIPADAAGNTGAKDWKCLFFSWFQNNLATEQGSQSLTFLTADGTIIAAVNIYRGSTGKGIAEFSFGSNCATYQFYTDTNSWLALGRNGHQHMEKDGGTLKYWYGSQYYTLADEAAADLVCARIQIKIGAYQGKPEMTRNYFGSLSFEKKRVQAETPYPSRYPAGSTITVDSNAGKVLLDGTARPDQEVFNSEYPLAPAGKTTMAVMLSSFYPASEDFAEITAEIEEKWI